jgi:hypothetical protein
MEITHPEGIICRTEPGLKEVSYTYVLITLRQSTEKYPYLRLVTDFDIDII